MHALLALIRKDLVLFLRDGRALAFHLVLPIIMGAFFGYLFGGDGSRAHVKSIQVVLVAQDQGALTQRIVKHLQQDSSLAVHLEQEAAARQKIKEGKAQVALFFPADFGDQLAAAIRDDQRKPELTLIYDPSQTIAMGVVHGALIGHVMQSLKSPDVASAAGGAMSYEQSLPFKLLEQQADAERPYNGYAHSFAGMAVQFILFVGIEVGIGLLQAQRQGLWLRYLSSPVSVRTILFARWLSNALISLGLLAAIFSVAALAFGVRVQGSLLGFVLVSLAFVLMASSFGLAVAAFGKTPEAAKGAAVFATLGMVMLGGAWVPSFVFPDWLQHLTTVVPVRWAVDGFDAMTWRGLGLSEAGKSAGVQLLFALIFLAIAVWQFRRTAPDRA